MKATQSNCFSQFERAVSTARLQPYGLGVDPPATVYARYSWNVALGESLYTSLHIFEVALRNAIHNAATKHFQNNPLWFDSVTRWNNLPLWGAIQQKQLNEARAKVKKSVVAADDIVAALPFGFWTAVFNKTYDRPLSTHIIPRVFPDMPRAERTRAIISERINVVNTFRNRVFHHEPIWRTSFPVSATAPPILSLLDMHDEILRLTGYINVTALATAQMADRFIPLWNRSYTRIERRYTRWVGTLPP